MTSIDQQKIKQIIEKRLIRVSPAVRRFFPQILAQNQSSWATVPSDSFLLVAFISKKDKKRIQNLTSQNYDPFPGLITLENNVRAAFRINDNVRNAWIEKVEVENA